MKKESLTLREMLVALKWLFRFYQERVIIVFLILFLISVPLVFLEREPAEKGYKLVHGFLNSVIIKGPTIKKKATFFCFLYNNLKTEFNVDLLIGLGDDYQIVFITEIDEKGQWHERSSLPADFPSDQLPRQSPKKIPPSIYQATGLPNRSPFFYKGTALSNALLVGQKGTILSTAFLRSKDIQTEQGQSL